MKISVVTAVYNRAETLADALASVHDQSWPALEHIIQDGGSTDGTLEVIKAHADPRVSLVSTPDGGIYDALNRGMARARGDVIGLMHSDDTFAHAGVLAEVATAFEDPAVDCVYGDLQYVSARDTGRVIRHWRAGPFVRGDLQRGWMPPHPTFYIRRQVVERWGDYDTTFQIAADYDAMLRWLWTGRLRASYIPQVMVKMRVGGESNRSLARILRKSREDYRALKKNGVGGVGALALKNARKISQFRI